MIIKELRGLNFKGEYFLPVDEEARNSIKTLSENLTTNYYPQLMVDAKLREVRELTNPNLLNYTVGKDYLSTSQSELATLGITHQIVDIKLKDIEKILTRLEDFEEQFESKASIESVRNLENNLSDHINLASQEINSKVSIDEFNRVSEAKADKADVNMSLAEKADKITVNEELALKADKNVVRDELAKKADSEFVQNELLRKADKETIEIELSYKANTSDMETLLAEKVDKVIGKGLSTEDYTTAEKNKLEILHNYNDSGIVNRLNVIESDYLKSEDKSTLINQINSVKSESNKAVSDLREEILGPGTTDALDTIHEIAAALNGQDSVIKSLETVIGSKVNTETFNAHVNNIENPHGVTKEQIGLGNVENVAAYSKENIDAMVAQISAELSLKANKDSIPSSTAELTNNSDFTTNAYVDSVKDDLNEEIAKKATSGALTELSTTVSGLGTRVGSVETSLSSKAAASELSTLKTTVDNMKTVTLFSGGSGSVKLSSSISGFKMLFVRGYINGFLNNKCFSIVLDPQVLESSAVTVVIGDEEIKNNAYTGYGAAVNVEFAYNKSTLYLYTNKAMRHWYHESGSGGTVDIIIQNVIGLK